MKQFGWAVLGVLAVMAVQPAWADTLLRLSETAHVQVKPDELVASLRVEAAAPAAATAQGHVNAEVAKALDMISGHSGVTATTGTYQVWQTTQPAQFHAAQTIQLTSGDGPGLQALVGTLQGNGMALERLAWQVSQPAAEDARREATRAAIGRLRARADEAAALLGLKFASFREVRLDGTPPAPQLQVRSLALQAAPAVPPPQAAAGEADIQATVGADAMLVSPTP